MIEQETRKKDLYMMVGIFCRSRYLFTKVDVSYLPNSWVKVGLIV